MILNGTHKSLGGFDVYRTLPTVARRTVGPWIFFDHMGPTEFGPGEGLTVRPHPHINLATVTYLFEGEVLHRDSLGYVQVIKPGDLNLMVAGRGIVHSERESEERRAITRRLHGLQLWMALPEEFEEVEPAFYHHAASEIPTATPEGINVRVMIGEAFGVVSPVKCYGGALYLEAKLKPGDCLTLPPAAERGLYVVSGTVWVQGEAVSAHSMAILGSEADVKVTAQGEAIVALVAGDPMPARFVEWNFVSSRKERIAEAKRDWKEGRFPKVPGDEVEFIPLPE